MAVLFSRKCFRRWRRSRFDGLAGLLLVFVLLLSVNHGASAQESEWGAVDSSQNSGATWRDSGTERPTIESAASSEDSSNESDVPADSGAFTGPTTTRYSLELSKLPDGDGQFWVVYDVAPYTDRFPNLNSPQDSIVDWIMFDSGEGFWRKEPFSVLSATRNRLYVYHCPSVQRYVSNIVDRFIDPEKKNVNFSIKVVVVQSPDWRSRVADLLTPLNVTVVGNGADVQGWQTNASNISKIASELAKRNDYVLLNTGKNVVPNAETFGWAAAQPRKEFKRDYRTDSSNMAGYSADVTSIDEGFRIETTPLLSTTGETLEMTFRYRSTVVERTKSYSMRVPTPTSPRQQLSVEKPSIVSCDFRGKISVPRSKGAVIDLGLVPLALPQKASETNGVLDGVSGLISQKSVFYNVILLIEEGNN